VQTYYNKARKKLKLLENYKYIYIYIYIFFLKKKNEGRTKNSKPSKCTSLMWESKSFLQI
jgi:hypothetical protein